MNKPKIYLAGKMTGLTWEEMTEWRNDAHNMFCYCHPEAKTIDPTEFYNFESNSPEFTVQEAMNFDLRLVKMSDIVLVNKDYPNSIGTAMELFYAKRVCDVPVIAFGTTQNHDWIECCIDKTLDKLEEAVYYIRDFYLVNF